MPLTYFPDGVRGAQPVNVTDATVTVSPGAHGNRLVTLNSASGIAVTLPPATGSGLVYKFFVGTTVTSNTTTIKAANASDTMAGAATQNSDGGLGAVLGWSTSATTDTVTFNGTTTGGIKGDQVILTDAQANLWMVQIMGSATGNEATPFSATV